jgi:DNA-binding LytR/AlgR family response regulator
MKYSCIIIDDEPDAHVVLKYYCEKLGNIEIITQCYNAEEAIRFFSTDTHIDFIFLDINMPEISGFGLLSIIKQQPKIIFTTAYAEYALKSYDYHAIDYLLKPIKWERFKIAIDKLKNRNTTDTQLKSYIHFEGFNNDILPSDIIYAASYGNYVKLFMGKKPVLVHSTMLNVHEKLIPYGFIRIHKQYIIQKALVTHKDNDKITLQNNISLPVGISYRQMIATLIVN